MNNWQFCLWISTKNVTWDQQKKVLQKMSVWSKKNIIQFPNISVLVMGHCIRQGSKEMRGLLGNIARDESYGDLSHHIVPFTKILGFCWKSINPKALMDMFELNLSVVPISPIKNYVKNSLADTLMGYCLPRSIHGTVARNHWCPFKSRLHCQADVSIFVSERFFLGSLNLSLVRGKKISFQNRWFSLNFTEYCSLSVKFFLLWF